MSKIDRLCELREYIINALGKNEYNVSILINTEENHLSAIYKGHRVCKIKDQYDYDQTYRVVFEGDFWEFYHPGLPRLARCSNIESIVHNIKHRITQVTLSDLRDYILQEIGDLVSAVYEVPTDGIMQDRIKINHDGCWVCNIYRKKTDYNLFTVIFYDPFICRDAGYSTVVDLTGSEIPRAIKNRINIVEDTNNTRINVNVDTGAADAMVYAYMSRGNGKTRFAMQEMFKKMQQDKYGPFAISDVIFNDPATIVFWADGTKTVVKCQNGEEFDPEKGLAMAISKKVLGNDYGYYETFAKYVGRYNKKRFNKALEKAKKIQPDEITYNGGTYALKNKED